ncbi:Asp23/Gls24 family envelope stress response protein [Actinoplanes rectilineatus]|uniref:Asp23/Gls24 family envelope stress response protein n=1 Tax=Actinoplanes rectilineatus TaxID=113571 RepID=UPI000697BA1E|nr:Asp23/Gls24 family envelope stress response protein [Actinoplanes rectilineatus]
MADRSAVPAADRGAVSAADRSAVPGADWSAVPAGGPARTGHDDPGDRGDLIVTDRAARRIAEVTARRVPGVVPVTDSGGAVGNALGLGYPRVDCTVSAGRVRAEVIIAGLWPVPAATLAAQVRSAVTDQLHRLAGLHVDSVDVTVAKVVRLAAAPGRRVR